MPQAKKKEENMLIKTRGMPWKNVCIEYEGKWYPGYVDNAQVYIYRMQSVDTGGA